MLPSVLPRAAQLYRARPCRILTVGDQPWSHRHHQCLRSAIQVRYAKTKTTVDAGELPQASLPPLPDTGEDVAPERKYPPLLQQHLDNMRAFSDCILLTRVGDFYEMYFDHVEQYAPLVNLKKARKPTALGDVPMAGFQHTQLDRYLKMFVQDLGKQVAISEQIKIAGTDRATKSTGPLYNRQVTRVITAGTLIDENFMDPYENNYLLAIHIQGILPLLRKESRLPQIHDQKIRSNQIGLSWVDLSSGDFFTQFADLTSLPSVIARINPREIVVDGSLGEDPSSVRELVGDGTHSIHFHDRVVFETRIQDWDRMLERPLTAEQQTAFTTPEIAAGSLVLDYVREKLRDTKLQLQPPVRKTIEEYMSIDKQSLRNLEIRNTLRDGLLQGSLLHALRRTVTKSGARLLSQRLVSPSTSLTVINNRLDIVQEMVKHDAFHEDITALLRRTSDTYRLLQKFSIGRGDADDLLSLARTVDLMQHVAQIVHEHIIAHQDSPSVELAIDAGGIEPDQTEYTFLWDVLGRLDLIEPLKVSKNIQNAIDEEGLNQRHLAEEAATAETEQMVEEVKAADAAGEKVPKLSRRKAVQQSAQSSTFTRMDDIWIMRRNASPTLESAHKDLDALFEDRAALTQRLRSSTGAESLTLKWTPGLGHFCHIKGKDARGTVTAIEGARTIGSTKSTVSFHIADWTNLGVRIDEARLRIRAEEDRFFRKLRSEVLENLMKLRRNAAVLDELDVACSSAIVAKERTLVRPILHEGTSHTIIGGRHPTVDVGLKEQGRSFTSNDCLIGNKENIYLITGPNMAGKSTFLRQNALITILAQTGCFVPAEYAEIGLVDKVFSRVGSADNLYQDQSTFMVEMLETAEILKHATPRSFVIMDEVGRGTTPEDGIAIGYACLHHLHHTNKSRSLFATHFHALADMTSDFDRLGCYCTDVLEQSDGSWTYIHKLRKGVNRSSHALKVAKLAGLPESAINVATEVLAKLQKAAS